MKWGEGVITRGRQGERVSNVERGEWTEGHFEGCCCWSADQPSAQILTIVVVKLKTADDIVPVLLAL